MPQADTPTDPLRILPLAIPLYGLPSPKQRCHLH